MVTFPVDQLPNFSAKPFPLGCERAPQRKSLQSDYGIEKPVVPIYRSLRSPFSDPLVGRLKLRVRGGHDADFVFHEAAGMRCFLRMSFSASRIGLPWPASASSRPRLIPATASIR